MHHKRKGPKSTRAGCLLCKPHKRQGTDEQRRQEQLARVAEVEQTTCGASLAYVEVCYELELDYYAFVLGLDYAWEDEREVAAVEGRAPGRVEHCEMPEPLRVPLVELLDPHVRPG